MNIRISAFEREDGLAMLRTGPDDRWLIRKVFGPSWFYDADLEEWRIVTSLSKEALDALALPFARALQLFETVTP